RRSSSSLLPQPTPDPAARALVSFSAPFPLTTGRATVAKTTAVPAHARCTLATARQVGREILPGDTEITPDALGGTDGRGRCWAHEGYRRPHGENPRQDESGAGAGHRRHHVVLLAQQGFRPLRSLPGPVRRLGYLADAVPRLPQDVAGDGRQHR